MEEGVIRLAAAALLPVLMTLILYTAEKKTAFGRLRPAFRQTLYGLLFGGLAVLGTEYGIPMNGAMMNCRDASVLTAGLLFGAPAGLIAGLIGGLERWFSVYWGVGAFTRTACSISTALAGVYAALLRKYMFEDKKPGVALSFAIGVVVEVFHLTMVFITNMATPEQAMQAVRACTVPMLAANSLSLTLSALVLTLLTGRGAERRSRSGVRISQTIQRWLLAAVALAFGTTSYFVYGLQDRIALTQADTLLALALDEVTADTEDASDANMIRLTRAVSEELADGRTHTVYQLRELAERYGLSEISEVNRAGIIINSTETDYVGYNMAAGSQSADFLCLLEGREEYVQDYGPISFDESVQRKYAGVRTDSGFVQIGYDAAHFQRDLREQMAGITRNRHVGRTGYILILDSGREVVSAPDSFVLSEDREALMQQEETTFSLQLGGEPCYGRCRTAEGYYIMSVLPEAEALQLRNIALYVNTFMEILVFAVLFGLIYLLIKRVVVNQIKSVNRSLARITDGDLNEVVNVRSNEEFASLSDDINTTVDTLKRYIAEASARIDRELEFAKDIQKSALPGVFPAFPKRKDFEIYARMDPAREVGGDFYDFYMIDGDSLHFLAADVSGKGIPAAMFMMRAKTELKSLTETGLPLAEVFNRGNDALCEGNDAGMFVTAWQGSLDLNTGLLQFINAGHNPPLVRRVDGAFEYLRDRSGFVLAGMKDIRYRLCETQLQPGDVLYLYTDGVTEATDGASRLYGEERLQKRLNEYGGEDMKALCDGVKADVDAFVGDAPQFDDITMVALRYNGKPPVPAVHFEAAELADIRRATEFVEQELEKLNCPAATVMQLDIAIDEIFSNIVRHGYGGRPGPVTLELRVKAEPRAVYLKFIDSAIPFNPLTNADPDVTLPARERKPGGLGIYMVKKSMDDVKYKYENGQNILTLRKLF